jgi:hypothetical protein
MPPLSGLSHEIDWERVAVWLLAVLLVTTSGFVAYFGSPYTAPADEMAEARALSGVSVTETDGSYVLTPTDAADLRATTADTTGIVFYPGARVAPQAYVPVFAPLVANTGITVVVPRLPLNLALLDTNAAGNVLASHPDVDRWYVAGHSLGGVAACRFADANPERVAGLLLFASYCDRDVSDTDLRVLAVTGSADTVLNRDAFRESRVNLPPDNRTVAISGMNHTQFGSYRGQPGDDPAPISYETAHERLRAVLVEFLEAAGSS